MFTARLHITIQPQLARLLAKIAKSKGMTRTAYIRFILTDAVSQRVTAYEVAR